MQPIDDPAALLAEQLRDLTRYRDILEAQRAVLRMGDAGLLDVFTAEANEIVSDISAREVRLLSLRAAAQSAAIGPRGQRLTELYGQVERERARAASHATTLAQEIARKTPEIAAAIRKSGKDLEQVVGGYGSRTAGTAPTIIDRRG